MDELINRFSVEQKELKNKPDEEGLETEVKTEGCSMIYGPLCQTYEKYYGHSRLHYKAAPNEKDEIQFQKLWDDSKKYSDTYMKEMRSESNDKSASTVGL